MSVLVQPPSVNHDPGNATGVSLAELIQRARNANGEERAWLCALVNKALVALPTSTDREQQAPVLVGMLDDEALHELVDDKGVPCRAMAVEALLTFGYPWALQLDPADLMFLREHPAVAKRVLPLAKLFSAGAGLAAVAFLAVSLWSIPGWWVSQLLHSPTELALVASLVLTVACAIPMAVGKPFLKMARWVMGLSSVLAAGIVANDALSHSPSWVHLMLLVIPALGLAATLLPREPAAEAPRAEEPPEPLAPTTT